MKEGRKERGCCSGALSPFARFPSTLFPLVSLLAAKPTGSALRAMGLRRAAGFPARARGQQAKVEYPAAAVWVQAWPDQVQGDRVAEFAAQQDQPGSAKVHPVAEDRYLDYGSS